MRKQFVKTLYEVADSDDKLVLLLSDISYYLCKDFAEKFSDRFYNIGICEQAVMGMASGMASIGLIPTIHNISPFLIERCYEQLKINFCYQKLGGNFISVGSAFDYPADGCTHHCYEDFAVLRALPGMEIIYPASEIEFDLLFKQTYSNGHPTYFRLPEKKHGVEFDSNQIVFGKGIKIKDGSKLTIVVTGPQLKNVIEATENYDVDIIYINTIKPLDERLIRESAYRTKRILTIEEHNIIGGLGDAVSLATNDIGPKSYRIGIKDKIIRNYGTYEEHCEEIGLSTKKIRNTIGKLI